MQVIRPYGAGTLESGTCERKLKTFKNEKKDFSTFASSDPKVVIAQRISAIDKIVRKPSEGNDSAPSQIHNLKIGE